MNNNARKLRSPQEERLINRLTGTVAVIVIVCPTLAIVGGLSVRLFHIVAGS